MLWEHVKNYLIKIREYMDELRDLSCGTIVIDTVTGQEYKVGPLYLFCRRR